MQILQNFFWNHWEAICRFQFETDQNNYVGCIPIRVQIGGNDMIIHRVEIVNWKIAFQVRLDTLTVIECM